MFEPITSDSSNSTDEDHIKMKKGFIIQTALDVNSISIHGYIA